MCDCCRYQNDLPKKIKGRGKEGHLTHEELVQTIKWKLAVSILFHLRQKVSTSDKKFSPQMKSFHLRQQSFHLRFMYKVFFPLAPPFQY